MSMHPALSERDRQILGVLVQQYVESGEAVSSLWLAHRGLGVSSATLRNILARLEEAGFLRQPHTSAGRVPTDLAYRCYVDSLLSARRSARFAQAVEARLRRTVSVDDLLSHASQEMARASQQLSFVVAPATETATLQHLDFVPLDGGKILVVLVLASGNISHKVVEPRKRYSIAELEQAAIYLNCQFRGKSLVAVRQAVVERLQEERSLYDHLMARALWLANTMFADVAVQPAIFIEGTSRLLEDVGGETPQATLETLRTLLRMIEEKARLVQLLDDYLSSDGLTIVIGSEHHSPDWQHLALIAATYSDGHGTGAVGVIGPTRMRYLRAINAVEGLSKAISRMVNARS